MNSLQVCTQCNGAISSVTQTCPTCGAATGRGRQRTVPGSPHGAAPQGVFLIIIDALRFGPGRRRTGSAPITEAVNDS